MRLDKNLTDWNMCLNLYEKVKYGDKDAKDSLADLIWRLSDSKILTSGGSGYMISCNGTVQDFFQKRKIVKEETAYDFMEVLEERNKDKDSSFSVVSF